MKCLFGHTRDDGFGTEPVVVDRSYHGLFGLYMEKFSRQDHVCKDCRTHFSTIIKLDPHTMKMMRLEKINPPIRLGDTLPRPYWHKKKKKK